MIKKINQLDLSKRYSYADYLTWQFDEMVELIRGRVFRMSPAPNKAHQDVSRNLLLQIGQYLFDKPCQVYHAPFDVRLPDTDQEKEDAISNTVVQPDISVICDLQKLDEKGCFGAPDWIIEILSKGTASKDTHEKFALYQSAGVKEYWIIHPVECTVLPYRLDDKGRYHLIRQTPYVVGEKIPVGIFSDLEIDLNLIFR